MSDIILSPEEIEAITQYKLTTMQLDVLRRRGFYRAYIGRKGVILERAHYDAVTRGQDEAPATPPRKVARLTNMRAA